MIKINKKIFIGILISVVLLAVFITSITSIDTYHIEHCEIENCTQCISISNAINFKKNMINALKSMNVVQVLILTIAIIKMSDYRENLNTLVESKVQFNE